MLIDCLDFVEGVPGVLPVRSPSRVQALIGLVSQIFGDARHARSWIEDCSEGDLSVLHECCEAAANWGR